MTGREPHLCSWPRARSLRPCLQAIALQRLAEAVTDGKVVEILAEEGAFVGEFEAAVFPGAEVEGVFADFFALAESAGGGGWVGVRRLRWVGGIWEGNCGIVRAVLVG